MKTILKTFKLINIPLLSFLNSFKKIFYAALLITALSTVTDQNVYSNSNVNSDYK